MRRDLKHAVTRGVDNGFTGPHVLLTQFVNNNRAGSRIVGQPAATGLGLIAVHHLWGKSIWVEGKGLV